MILNNDIKNQIIYGNNINSAILSSSENINSQLSNINSAFADTNVRLDSIAGNTLSTAINTRDSAYSLNKIASMFDIVDVPLLDSLPDSNSSSSLDSFTSEQNSNFASINTSLDSFKTNLDIIYSDIEDIKTSFNDSLSTIQDLKNNDLTIRTGNLVNTDVTVFGHSVHFDMYSSFSAFKPIGTFIFTLMFLYLILSSSIRILIQGK